MEQNLKVLMISSDRNILTQGSAVSERMKEYGALVEELHIVVFSDQSNRPSVVPISTNVFAYPTNSFHKILRPIDAASLGKKIVFKNKFIRGKSLITTQDPFATGLAGVMIKRKWRLPLEIQIHTDLTHSSNFLSKYVLARADSVRDVKDLPIYVDKEKIDNAPITFDVHARYPWHFIVLMVCRLEPEKNLSLAVEIINLVRQKYSDAGLLIVGSGSLERSLKGKPGVELAGWQSDLASFYKTSNAFLQTSLYEGYGLALVEAGLSGLPVLSTPVGIATELQDGKELYICNTAEEFASRIIELIESNNKRENLKFNLKNTLESKLLSKADYMAKIKANWEAVSNKIK